MSPFQDISPKIVERFLDFHAANPVVYELFKRYAREVRNSGRARYGAGAIYERVRWHLSLETTDPLYKLNNNWRSCYARLLVDEDASFAAFFEMRRSPAAIARSA